LRLFPKRRNKRPFGCANIIVVVVVVNSVVLMMGSLTNIPPNVPFAFHEQLHSAVHAANFERCARYRECTTRPKCDINYGSFKVFDLVLWNNWIVLLLNI